MREFSSIPQRSCRGTTRGTPPANPPRFVAAVSTLSVALVLLCIQAPSAEGAAACGTVNCTAGEYYAPSDLACITCPAGYHCAGGANPPIACGEGTYSAATGATDVSTCVPCSSGTYSANAGSASCATCPAGEYANTTSLSSCTTCPAGYKCPNPANNPVQCGAGTVSVAGQVYCTSCDVGQTSVAGQFECTDCPAGYRCPNPGEAELCSPGTASLNAQSSCSACNNGFYANQTGASVCRPCPAGYKCPNPAATPTICPAGTYSPSGETECTPCAEGFYSSSAGWPSCQLCPPGYSCFNPDDPPLTCEEGYYSGGGTRNCTLCPIGTISAPLHASCLACPAGSRCPDPRTGATDCLAGYWSPNGTTIECEACPAGHRCPTATDPPIACTAGTYSTALSTTCDLCPAGQSCLDPADAPVNCAEGTYSLEGEAICERCPAGKYCFATDKTPVDCPTGSYSTTMEKNCTLCPSGHACPVASQPPVACVAGEYAPAGSTVCLDCPPGFACPNATSSPDACHAGSYALARSTSCTDCVPGEACKTNDARPVVCPAGTWSSALAVNCTDCLAGYACPSTTSPAAIYECPSGTYSEGRTQSCTPCPVGFECPFTHTAVEVGCAAGYYSRGGAANCTRCPAGWQCPYPDGSSNAACPDGYYSEGGVEYCTGCPAGDYCPDSTVAASYACPAGSYSLGGADNCTLCPAGYECPSTSSDTMTACTPGSYSLRGQSVCTPCPPGYACPDIDIKNEVACAPGSYSTGSATICTDCTAGSYCPTTTDGPYACAQGFYSADRALNCTICPAGSFCNPASAAPQPCSAGEYSYAGATACSPCDAGYQCAVGSTNPTPAGSECPLGGYCPYPSGVYVPCPAGTYGNVTGAGSLANGCQPCPEGYYCLSGSSLVLPSMLCPAGFYCPEGTRYSTEFPCVAGYYSTNIGLKTASECLLCPAGSYCPTGASANFACAAGYFCPAGSDGPTDNPCPLGTYSSSTGLSTSSQCAPCPAGSYCGLASSSPLDCVPGTYNPSVGAAYITNCLDCPPGRICSVVGLSAPDGYCAEGYYCPAQSSAATTYPCPPGTQSSSTNLTAAADCEPCTPGYACTGGTGGVGCTSCALAPVDCTAGYYCPEGTSSPTAYGCPAGTYSSLVNLNTSDDCWDCPAGSYCLGYDTAVSGVCPMGYYCPQGTGGQYDFPCPGGTYNGLTSRTMAEDCDPCPKGNFCPSDGQTAPTPVLPGTYANKTGTVESYDATTCPAGYYCPEGAVVPLECGTGNYSAAGAGICSVCEAGYYCDSNTTSAALMYSQPCSAGMYCPDGHTKAPDLVNEPCPAGYYCEEATPLPVACPAGYLQPITGAEAFSECVDCPPGFYCLAASTNVTGECSPGYYCESNSIGPTQEPCPAMYYNPSSRGESVGDCSVCEAGYYCEIATADPIDCPPGYYCKTSSFKPEPCPLGTFSNSTNLRDSEECTACSGGYYCDGLGLTEPRGRCDPGYYCKSGAYTSAPPDGETGGLCPAGGYCEVGSSIHAACPAGTYNNYTGGRSASDCVACPAGYYCEGSNQASPSGPCQAGYYCTGGASTKTQYPTPPGSSTDTGAVAPVPCLPGYYQPNYNGEDCLECKEGFYCPDTNLTVGTICPRGSYCPKGSAVPKFCPQGTYSNAYGLVNASQCIDCTAGQYCLTNGLTSPTGDCAQGYVCSGRATVSTPLTGLDGGYPCPAGAYCPGGVTAPTECPVGTYGTAQFQYNVSSCITCTDGRYCNSTGLTAPEGGCAPGYYCVAGTIPKTPAAGLCPVGNYCPGNTPSPYLCNAGTYNNITGQSSCFTCPAGYYCPDGTVTPKDCPQGSYCPAGTTHLTIVACPAGTYGATKNLRSVSGCTECTGGSYCAGTGNTGVTGPCAAGYYCDEGVDTDQPTGFHTGTGGICTAGNYCPTGTKNPDPCPLGTFSNSLGLANATQCNACPYGSYCESTGLTAPTGKCYGGYYCKLNAVSASPPNDVTGGICPVGHFCPNGTGVPIQCEEGTYNDRIGQSACTECPAGFYCPSNATDFITTPCDPGYYCPAGTRTAVEFPCPAGTFSNVGSLRSEDECTGCTAGWYCDSPALTGPTALCTAGWYCSNNATSPTPADPAEGGACAPGEFCPTGSPTPTPCSPGYYCASPNLATPTGKCAAGYYCSSGAIVASPLGGGSAGGDICPAGAYCPLGSQTYNLCPPGTYLNGQGHGNLTDCVPCTSGFYCNTSGLTAVSGECDAGWWCGEGENVAAPTSQACPVGHYCPEGSPAPFDCLPGYYQSATQQDTCLICPPGFYCNTSAPIPLKCPAGYYCPESTRYSTEFPCPIGTFSSIKGLVNSSQCTPCSAGSYCEEPGLTAPTSNCSAGYYCDTGASTPTPTDGISGDICQAGTYCPPGSVGELLCPPGTYGVTAGSGSLDDGCLACDAGYYCDLDGMSSPAAPCDGGFVCLGGADTPTPIDGVTGYRCPRGSYCPSGTLAPIGCFEGTYNGDTGRSLCYDCPVGRYCPIRNMTTHDECPAGYYCDGATAVPESCPPGTFGQNPGLADVSACDDCLPGMYCLSSGYSVPDGNCSAGYYCPGGSATPTPSGVYPDNGPCPAGNWCPSGTLNPVPCDPGTYNPTTGGDSITSCLPCAPGDFCAESGLTAPTGNCSAGYYCPSALATSTDKPTGYECPRGAYCPAGSSFYIGCAAGTYQPLDNKATCNECPAGSYCPENSTTHLDCPAKHYCPAGTGYPPLCPNGTYTTDTGLESPDDCTVCPAGKYCANGQILGDCAAGYICLSGSWSPKPETYADPAFADLIDPNCEDRSDNCGVYPNVGGLCPKGHYCEAGATTPTVCTNKTVRAYLGGDKLSDCTPCPAGFECVQGDPVPVPCAVGYYCPYNGNPEECPAGSFSTATQAENSLTCSPCPAGYWCYDTAMGNYSISPCPAGSFCPSAVLDPIECPSGTYRGSTKARNLADCADCPGGYMCGDGTIQPEGCAAGTYCPEGAWNETTCPGGSYCPLLSDSPTTCPAGYYCPTGASTPSPCPDGYYCTAGVDKPTLCRAGYMSPPNSTSDRTSFAGACTICPPGTHGSHPSRAECEVCEAGYICWGASTTGTPVNSSQGGEICPAGYYCPAGALWPTPCPPSTYGPGEGLGSEDECEKCPVNTFNSEEGVTACFPCGSSSWSESGATECICNGTDRSYQPTDGWCVCNPGYEFYDANLQLSEADSALDCQPIVYDRCFGTAVRVPSGECVEEGDNSLCDDDCVSGSGTLSSSHGICECEGIVDIDEVCNASCRAEEITLTIDPTWPGYVTVSNVRGNISKVFAIEDVPFILGTPTCPSTSTGPCRLFPVAMTDAGFTSVYGPIQAWIDSIFGVSPIDTGPYVPVSTGASVRATARTAPRGWGVSGGAGSSAAGSGVGGSGFAGGLYSGIRGFDERSGGNFPRDPHAGRRLLATDNSAVTGIDNPSVCLEQGESLVWTTSSDRGSYPVYDKDNLFNTNDGFDYGAFRDLAERMRTNLSISAFAFTFTEEGVYVFKDAATERSMVVGVQGANEQCPKAYSTGRAQPKTASNLISLGVTRESGLLLEPDWYLIGGLLLGLAVLVSALVGGLYFFRTKVWTAEEDDVAPYRRLALREGQFDHLASRGSTTTKRLRHMEEGGGVGEPDAAAFADDFWDYERQIDLEGFNVRTFYDKLNDQTLFVTAELARQQAEVKAFYDTVANQNEELKAAIFSKLDVVSARSGAAGTGTVSARPITDEDRVAADARVAAMEAELDRRSALAAEHAELLRAQLEIIDADDAARQDFETRQRSLAAAIAEASEEFAAFTAIAKSEAASPATLQRLHALTDAMADAAEESGTSNDAERERRRVAVTGEGVSEDGAVGAVLCTVSKAVISMSELTNSAGELREGQYITVDPVTQLFVPTAEARLLVGGKVVPVPPFSAVHPGTGRVLPMAGSTGVDCMSGRVVFTADAAVDRHPRGVVPYVPTPLTKSGKSTLGALKRLAGTTLVLSGTFEDAATGRTVPILAATIDPVSRKAVPLGGVMDDPLTGLAVPITIGALMHSRSRAGEFALVTGVAIDPEEHRVVPVGGNYNPNGKSKKTAPLLLGAPMVEPYSGRETTVCGAAGRGDSPDAVVPVFGSYDALLDASELRLEDALIFAAEELVAVHDALLATADESGRLTSDDIANFDRARKSALSAVQSAGKSLVHARGKNRTLRVRLAAGLRVALRSAETTADTGGALGTYMDPVAAKNVPLLLGGAMYDPASGLEVPILDVSRDPTTGRPVPVGGSMVDPSTGATVPIRLGAKMRLDDGFVVPVAGAALDAASGRVHPTDYDTGDPRNRAPPGAKAAVDAEVAARNSYERQARLAESEMLDTESAALIRLAELVAGAFRSPDSIADLYGALDDLASDVRLLAQDCESEGGRRRDLHVPDVGDAIAGELLFADAHEAAAETEFSATHRRIHSAIRSFTDKVAAVFEREGYAADLTRLTGELDGPVSELVAAGRVADGHLAVTRAVAKAHRLEAQRMAGLMTAVAKGSARTGGAAGANAAGTGAGAGDASGLTPEIAALIQQLTAAAAMNQQFAAQGGYMVGPGGQGYPQQQQQQQYPQQPGYPGGPAGGGDGGVSAALAEHDAAIHAALENEAAADTSAAAAEVNAAAAAAARDREALRKRMEAALTDVESQEEIDAAVAKYLDEARGLEDRLAAERKAQHERMLEKRAARRAAKMAEAEAAAARAAAAAGPDSAEALKHTATVQALQDEAAADDELDEDAQELERVKEAHLDQARKAMEEELAEAKSAEERAAILDEYAREVNQLEAAHARAIADQQAAARQRIEAKRRQRAAARAARAAGGAGGAGGGEAGGKKKETLSTIKDEGIVRQKEDERLRAEAEKEAADALGDLIDREHDAKDELLRDQTNQLVSDLVAKGSLDEEAKEALLAGFSSKLHELDNTLASERARQEAAVREKVEARRRKKREALEKRHAAEAANVAAAHKAALDGGDADVVEEAVVNEAALRERQEAEKAALIAQLETELAQELAETKARMLAQKEERLRKAQLELVNDLVDDGSLNEAEKDTVLAAYKANVAQLETQIDAERERQRAEMRKKVAAKRKARAEREAAKAAAAAAAAESVAPTQIVSEDGTLAFERVDVSAEIAAEAELVKKAQERREKELAARQERELKEAAEALAREAAEEERRAVEAAEAERAAKLRELQAQQAAELEAAQQQQMTETERAQILDGYKAAVKATEAQMEGERERQRRLAKEKREARKRRKMEALEREQAKERARVEAAHREEITELSQARTAEAEREKLLDALQSTPAERHQELIQMVLEARHTTEMDALAERQKGEVAAKIQAARDEQAAKHAEAADALHDRHASEAAALEAQIESEGMDEDAAADARVDLRHRHAMEAAVLEREHEIEEESVQAHVMATTDRDMMVERFALREKQYKEFAELVQELAPEQALLSQDAEAAAARAAELEELQFKLESEAKAQAEEQAAERARLLAEADAKRAEEMARFQAEVEAEIAAEEAKAAEQLERMKARREAERAALKAEQAKELQAQAAAKQLTPDEVDALRIKFEEDQAAREAKIDSERARQRAARQARIEMRRKKKREAQEAKIKEMARKTEEEIKAKQRAERAQLDAKQSADLKGNMAAERAAAKFLSKSKSLRRSYGSMADVAGKAAAANSGGGLAAMVAAGGSGGKAAGGTSGGLSRSASAAVAGSSAASAKPAAAAAPAAVSPSKPGFVSTHAPVAAIAGPFAGAGGGRAAASGPVTAAMSEEQWAKLLARLDDLEGVLREQQQQQQQRSGAGAGAGAASASASAGGAGGEPVVLKAAAGATEERPLFIDPRDADWVNNGPLESMEAKDLAPARWVTYKFGVFVTELLHKTLRHDAMNVFVARSLPPNRYYRNAFRNSYWVDEAAAVPTVHVREERFESVGDLVLVLVHAAAHIRVGDMADDTRPEFVAEFYSALRVVCAELFYSRGRTTSIVESHLGRGAVGKGRGENTLEALFRTVDVGEHASLIDSLVDTTVHDEGTARGEDEVMPRLEGYSSAAMSAQLNAQLYEREKRLRARGTGSAVDDAVARRLSALDEEGGSSGSGRSGRGGGGSGGDEEVDSVEASLLTSVTELNEKIDSLTKDLLAEKKKASKVSAKIRDGEAELAAGSGDADELNAKLDKHRKSLEKIEQQETVINKQLAVWKDELDKKSAELESYRNRSSAERNELTQSRLQRIRAESSVKR